MYGGKLDETANILARSASEGEWTPGIAQSEYAKRTVYSQSSAIRAKLNVGSALTSSGYRRQLSLAGATG